MLVASVLNYVIRRNPEVQAQLMQYAQTVFALQTSLWRTVVQIGTDGLLYPDESQAQTLLMFQDSAWLKILQKQKPSVGDIEITGNIVLGTHLLTILSGLKYQLSDDIAQLCGADVAMEMMDFSADCKAKIQQWHNSIDTQMSQYAQQPNAAVVHQEELFAWVEQVADLRDAVARLEAKLNQLTDAQQ